MPPTGKAKLKLVSRRDACERLGCQRNAFWRNWHPVFTETRPPEKRKRCDRKVYSDELDVAVENAAHGAAAVLNHRRRMGRLK